jgi:type IV secretion system protein VirB5
MFRKSLLAIPLVVLLSLGLPRPAAAQWAVIDVASLAQLAQEYETLQQQLTTVHDHLAQARQQYAALTGDRGMERLLAGQTRNYLPTNWNDVQAVLQGTGGAYGSLAASAHSILTTNAVLSAQDLARLSASERVHLDGARQSAALLQAVSRQALSTTSDRFTSLQQLIDAISSAGDPKAILDLQARISAEQGMLANDSAKLQVLYQAAQAEQWAQQQRRQEQAIADIGSLRSLPPMGLR